MELGGSFLMDPCRSNEAGCEAVRRGTGEERGGECGEDLAIFPARGLNRSGDALPQLTSVGERWREVGGAPPPAVWEGEEEGESMAHRFTPVECPDTALDASDTFPSDASLACSS